MHSHKGRFEPTRFDDLTVTVDFHCHSACRFCIVQEGMNYFRGVPLDTFREAVERNRVAPRYRRVTFTGGEVTLEEKLFDYLEVARASGSFEQVRLQTNGRRLADLAFTERLVAAGVTEFFVSLHGHDAASQDYISQRPGSFDEAIAGLANVKRAGAHLLTNTVITTLNVEHLADVVDTVRPFSPSRMEFWNYLPMEDFADERGLIAPLERLGPGIRAALARVAEHGIAVGVKYVPRCVMGEFGQAEDNTQSDVVIVEEFYDIYPKFTCIHEARCAHAETCLGLTHAYVNKFGWEEGALTPTPRTTPWREPEYGAWSTGESAGGGDAHEAAPNESWRALVAGVAEAHGAVLTEVLVQRRACVYRFALGEASVDVVLTARDSGAALARSQAFDVHYRNVLGAPSEALRALIRAAAEAVLARDRGQLALDVRKGLVGAEHFRRRPRTEGRA
jgi:sulfatase maturation enzyme AslB (radical SAM superfamily)